MNENERIQQELANSEPSERLFHIFRQLGYKHESDMMAIAYQAGRNSRLSKEDTNLILAGLGMLYQQEYSRLTNAPRDSDRPAIEHRIAKINHLKSIFEDCHEEG